MKVEIISIGDELLIGQTINTNASWMGQQLAQLGAEVLYCTVIRDQREDMLAAFKSALSRTDVVLVTGGLGPTRDDITKHVLCEFFETKMIRNEEVLKHVQKFFADRNRVMLPVNELQADVPEISEVLHNEYGTAPGMWFDVNGKILVSMPGVPYEMKSIMTTGVFPRLTERFELESLYYRTMHTQGIGESYIADRITELESEIRDQGIGMAYLPSPGGVRLRLSSRKTPEMIGLVENYIEQLSTIFPEYTYGFDGEKLSEVVGRILSEQGKTMSSIESCTGGALSASIVSIAGSSAYYLGSIVSYDNEIKINTVGVKPETIEEHGVVSQPVVEEMAENGKKILGTDYAVALSGVAGPDGGSEEKPVGTVWIAVSGPDRTIAKKFQFEKVRERNIKRSVLTALNLLRCELLKINIEKS